MLRQSLIAAALAVATITASAGSSSAASVTTGPAQHQVVVQRTVVHHVYRYEPASAPYYDDGYYAPAYAPAPPLLALPAAAACVALSLIGGC